MEVQGVKKPPLELKHHFFTEVLVTANQDVPHEEIKQGKQFGCEVNMEVGVVDSPDNDREFQVQLSITAVEAPSHVMGYRVKLVAVGFIVVAEDIPAERRKGLVHVVGASILYGAAREFLYGITMRGPYPPIYLPTTTFIPDADTCTEGTLKVEPSKRKSRSLPKNPR